MNMMKNISIVFKNILLYEQETSTLSIQDQIDRWNDWFETEEGKNASEETLKVINRKIAELKNKLPSADDQTQSQTPADDQTQTPPATTPPATEIQTADEIRAKVIARIQDEIGNLDPQKITRSAKEVFTPILKKTIDKARTASEGLPQLAALKKEMQAYKPNIPASPRRNIGDAPKYKKRVNTKGY